MKFVGRQKELGILQKLLHTPNAELAVLYGRRRIGKTALVSLFLEQQGDTPSFYWMATTHNETTQLRDFSQAMWRHDPRFSEPPAADFSFASWEEALLHMADVVELRSEPHLMVLDEFTYLLRNEPAISSVIQKVWDHRFSKIPQMKLILTGSLIGMMAREVFSHQAPLYGRATTLLHLRALPFTTLTELFPKRSAAERVAIYAVAGGVPAYLELFTRSSTFVEALKEHCLSLGSIMLSDPAVIIYEQLTEPQSYESILSAIAAGSHAWSDIAKMAGIKETNLGHYLKLLQELELSASKIRAFVMSRIASFEYSNVYRPPAPFIPITVEGSVGRTPVTVSAFVDSGADGTMLPLDLLQSIGAEYEDRVWLSGTAGGRQLLDSYTVTIRVETETAYGISAVATPIGSEPLIGRDVLNQLVVTLHGLASVTEIQLGP